MCNHTFTLHLWALLSLNKGESGDQMSFISSLDMFNLMKQIVFVRLQGAAGERRLLAQTETTWIYADSCVCSSVEPPAICSNRWRWREMKSVCERPVWNDDLTYTDLPGECLGERKRVLRKWECVWRIHIDLAYYHYFGGMQYFSYAWNT